jgi:hypothetical protein
MFQDFSLISSAHKLSPLTSTGRFRSKRYIELNTRIDAESTKSTTLVRLHEAVQLVDPEE